MARNEVQTEGRDRLKNWLAARDRGAQSELADRLGVSVALVSQWVAGSCRPGPIYRDALETACGIDPREWQTDAEKERRLRALQGPQGERQKSNPPPPASDDEPDTDPEDIETRLREGEPASDGGSP